MTTSAAINPKGPRPAAKTGTPGDWLTTYVGSSVGQKILVAVTGLSLAIFVVFHMIGNLKMFHGPESINKYAHFLKHDLGALIWIARGGLLLTVTLHIMLALRLKMKSNTARPVGYHYQQTAQATAASKTMTWTGIVVGFFIAFHLAHYTFACVHQVPTADGRGTTNYLDLKYTMPDGKQVHDVYAMVVSGFTTWWIAAIYLISQVVLFVHLSHGLQSSLTTLGLVGKRFQPAAKSLGYAVAATILVGNLALVLGVWLGYVK